MTEHKITETITLIDDGTGVYNPENLEVRVGKELYDWIRAPKEAQMDIIKSGIVQELRDAAELNEHENTENNEADNPKKQKTEAWKKPERKPRPFVTSIKAPVSVQDLQVKELTTDDIIKYICPNATEPEAYMFLKLCQARNLNPFTGEAYLIKYSKTSKFQMVVGKETFTRRAENNEKFQGFEAGIIVRAAGEKTIERREGSFYIYGEEELLGGWAKVWIEGRTKPFVSEVSLSEYIGKKGDGTVSSMWRTKPATMIRKDALVQALREALPSELGGLYDEAEINVEDDS